MEIDKTKYEIGSLISNQKVTYIYYKSKDIIVFLDENKQVRIETENEELAKRLAKIRALYSIEIYGLADDLGDKNDFIAGVLKNCIILGYEEAVLHLKKATDACRNQKRTDLRLRYVRVNFYIAVAVTVVAFLVYSIAKIFPIDEVISSVVYFMCAGGLGGFTSTLISVNSINEDLLVDKNVARLNSIFRSALAMIFGNIGAFACYTGLIIPVVKGNVYALFIVAFASGFSEKMVPSILEKIEKAK